MMRTVIWVSAMVLLAAVVAGCSSRPAQQRHGEAEWHAPVEMLIRYADKDGNVTRADMEAGLRRDFDAADTNHDGVLEPDEVRAVNEARWKEDASAASPLIDWNQQGFVDFNEFAATARSLFQQLDVEGKGILTAKQLKAMEMGPAAPEGGEGEGEHRREPRGDDGLFRGDPQPESSWH